MCAHGACVLNTNPRVDGDASSVLQDVCIHTLRLDAAACGHAVGLRVASIPLDAKPVRVVVQAATVQLK